MTKGKQTKWERERDPFFSSSRNESKNYFRVDSMEHCQLMYRYRNDGKLVIVVLPVLFIFYFILLFFVPIAT